MDEKNVKQAKSKELKKEKNTTPYFITCILLLLIIIIILLLRSCSPTGNTPTQPGSNGDFIITDEQRQQESSDPAGQEQSKENQTITFAGYGKATVTKEKAYLELSNPARNFAWFKFTVTDTDGNQIAVTDPVAPGKYAYVNVYNHFKNPGTYIVNVQTSTLDPETNSPLNGMNQQIEVIIQ